MVQIHDLTPDTTYIFRVQALSPEGNPGSYSVEHDFHTSPLGTNNFKIYRPNAFSSVCPSTFFFHMLELINLSLLIIFFCAAEPQIQNNSTIVMGAVIGVAVILLVVVAVVLLRKRLVTTLFISTFNACIAQINVICSRADCVIMCHKLK